MRRTAVIVMLFAVTIACNRRTAAEKHLEEDYTKYHQQLEKERAEAEYRKTPGYQEKVRKQQEKADAAWRAYADSLKRKP